MSTKIIRKSFDIIRFINDSIPAGLEDDTMKVEDDMIIFRDVKTSNSAVYQCNVSNEFGYLLANAFVNVLCKSEYLTHWCVCMWEGGISCK